MGGFSPAVRTMFLMLSEKSGGSEIVIGGDKFRGVHLSHHFANEFGFVGRNGFHAFLDAVESRHFARMNLQAAFVMRLA
jgi:hypothetical protein